MTFLDTSAIYALADRADANHERARRVFSRLTAAGESFLVHSYVLIESVAILQHRIGIRAAGTFLEDARSFEIEWITPEVHDEAVARWRSLGARQVSLVDVVSFVVMRARSVRWVFAFDPHFDREGFRVINR